MDKDLEKYLIAGLVMILILLSLSGCVKKQIKVDHPKQPTLIETISNMGNISTAIGCVFAPWHEECKGNKKDKPHQTQEEYLQEVNEDFNKLEDELETSNGK